MKSNKELLDFYGVEIGKKYKITGQNNMCRSFLGETFEIKDDGAFAHNSTTLSIVFIEKEEKMYLYRLSDFDYEEVKEILTDKEKEYLSAVIKPFRDSVITIEKLQFPDDKACIHIEYRRCDGAEDCTYMPMFNINDLYLGMKNNQKYTLEELGL